MHAEARAEQTASAHTERGLRLAELILARSRDAGPRAGARLPTERQLSIDLGVTRSSVRTALALLEAQGRISREVGRGTFLRALPAADAGWRAGRGGRDQPDPGRASSSADFAPADVMTIRRLLEPPAMVLVVAWATAADLEEMDRCLALGDRAAHVRGIRGLRPGPAPMHHGGKPQPAACRSLWRDRGRPPRAGLGRPEAAQRLALSGGRSIRPITGR